MKLEMSLNINLGLELSPFASDSLPLTMTLARKFRNKIYPLLCKYPKKWPFEDKVLAMLIPTIIDKIKTFHNGKGNMFSLDILYGPNLLEQLDGKLSEILSEKLACK
jgi:hypothetical protein